MKKHTEDIIKEEALLLFMNKGYEGTSLANIGDKVGIKKQSIYTHFKNKDDLFFQVFDSVIKKEVSKLNNFFKTQENENVFSVLYNLIDYFKGRFQDESDNLKFLVRMMFTPPFHIEKDVIQKILKYYEILQQHVSNLFMMNENQLTVNYNEATAAFLNMIDGLLVELNYINITSFDERQHASWRVFRKGIERK